MSTDNDVKSLTCPMCAQLYTDPSMLPCLHSFCEKCLLNHTFKAESTGYVRAKGQDVICPLCEQASRISHSLPNRYLARRVEEHQELTAPIPCEKCATQVSTDVFCRECSAFLCPTCTDRHKESCKTKDHSLVDATEEKRSIIAQRPHKPLQCPIQEHNLLKYYCKVCRVLACSDCMLREHRCHTLSGVSDEHHIADIENGIQQCAQAAMTIDDAIQSAYRLIEQIQTRKNQVDQKINATFDALQAALDSRRKALLDESNEIATSKKADVHIQRETWDEFKHRLSFTTKFATDTLQSHQPKELLSVKKHIEDRLASLKGEFEHLSCEITEDNIIFASLNIEALCDEIAHFGEIADLSPFLSAIESGVAVPLATVNKERKFTVSLKNTSGNAVKGESPILPVASVAIHGATKRVEAVMSKEDQCTLTCTPDTVGEYELSVKVRGTHIKNSPYRMWARQERFLFARQQTYDVGSKAFGVAVHSNGDVFATGDGGYIKVFSSSGSEKIGTKGSGDRQFHSPRGIALVGDILYVADSGNHRVQKWTITGEYLGKFGSHGSGDGQLSDPEGIAYDGKDHIMIADRGNKRIQVFTLDGIFVKTINCDDEVWDVAVDNDDNIHVPLYSKQNIVQVFSSDGTKLPDYSNMTTKLYYPEGIAIDDNGCRYITTYDSKLHILSPTGSQLSVIEGFKYPYGVALSPDTNGCLYIYVADWQERKIFRKYI